MLNKRSRIVVLILLTAFPLAAQEHEAEGKEKIQRHKLILFTGYHLSFDAVDSEGEAAASVLPAFGLTYEYRFSEKIALAWVNEIALSSYYVELDSEKLLEREYPVTSALVFVYEILRGWSAYAGPGYEFEGNENYFVVKIGTDIVKEFENGWLAGFAFSYDIKEVNNIFGAGVIIGKKLGKIK